LLQTRQLSYDNKTVEILKLDLGLYSMFY